MRDGVTLHTEILIPSGPTRPLPILFRRTPYGAPDVGPKNLAGGYRELAEEGYIFVVQDIRGRYRSGGSFVMQRPLRNADSLTTGIDETTDAYDTIEWLMSVFASQSPGYHDDLLLIDSTPVECARSRETAFGFRLDP